MAEIDSIPGLTIREEKPEDLEAAGRVAREAFFNRYAPGCSEHFILHLARKAQGFEPWHSQVAIFEGQVIGQVLLVPAIIKTAGHDIPVFTLGPVCVLPACAGRGIGSTLMRTMIRTAKDHGARALFLMGDPQYYRRFGFSPASGYGIHLPGTGTGETAEYFMALPLFEGALRDTHGVFHESAVYQVDEQALAEFEKGFPPREKMRLPGQLR